MAKWEVPTPEEEAELRAMGKDPAPMVVNRVGVDSRLYMNVRTREEIYATGEPGIKDRKVLVNDWLEKRAAVGG